MILTYRFRVKDKHAARLNAQARAVNFVWNYCNETQRKVWKESRRFLSHYSLNNLVAGAVKEGLGLHSHSARGVCQQYAQSRIQQRKAWLKWRGVKSLGWVPFDTGHAKPRDGGFVFHGVRYDVWLHRPLPAGAKLGQGSFSADARGRWYINLSVEVPTEQDATTNAIGLDLGLKTLAAGSDGSTIEMPAYARAAEARIGMAQRAGKKRLARNRYTKVRNQRRDYLHKASAHLARDFGLIIVGDVSPSQLSQTRMAKSVLDAGWSDFRGMLSYKAIRHGGRYLEVNEAFTTRTCSSCLAVSGPQGVNGLRVREWTCLVCGEHHDRDSNAARNILRLGQQSLVEGAVA